MSPPPAPAAGARGLAGYLGVFRYSRAAIELVWSTSRPLTLWFGALTLIAGILPAGIAWVGKLIVDAVVAALSTWQQTGAAPTGEVLQWVALEAMLVIALTAVQRGISTCQSLLRAQLGQRVNVMILDKALTLRLAQFEDSEFYDKLTRARREASTRPLSLVTKTFGLAQNAISLLSFAALLVQFSPWAVLILVLAGLPAFLAETHFSGEAFRLFRWRSPETRQQMYLETVLAREDYAKEVQLYELGPEFLDRYQRIFEKLYGEDRRLTIRRDLWGFFMGLIGSVAFYGAYAWIALSTVFARITLGEMTMYLMVFKQGQTAVASILSSIGGMYEDNLYLSNLYEYLEQPVEPHLGRAVTPISPDDGLRFEDVWFTYPGQTEPALKGITLHVRPGQSLALVGVNGSGKTTLIKLLTGLYQPQRGRILLQGRPLEDWDRETLRKRIGVIFQDFARYQLQVGENIGVGDIEGLRDETRWRNAAIKGKAAEFVDTLPAGYLTQLGRWFADGRELSMGQWQKIALARAFMREGADILVLDEPTAAVDAAAEAEIFEHFQELTAGRIAILISHRFSTVRRADLIVVIEQGQILEQGRHSELMAANKRYARLFELQAEGYR
jgi:ATP-binding cassette, subfamily B, bacterial